MNQHDIIVFDCLITIRWSRQGQLAGFIGKALRSAPFGSPAAQLKRYEPKFKMKEFGCKHCGEVCQVYEIVSPSDLKKAIRVVQDNIADRTIVESNFWPQGKLKPSRAPFSDIQANGPYDDVLICYFECPECNQLFQLSAETYHGSGGAWKPIDRDSL